jgi:hypothetical protein
VLRRNSTVRERPRIEIAILVSVGYPTDSTFFNRQYMCDGGDAPQTRMGRTTEFSRLGLLRMQMGVQLCRSAHRRIAGRDDKSLQTAARQGVHISFLRRILHPAINKVVTFSHIAVLELSNQGGTPCLPAVRPVVDQGLKRTSNSKSSCAELPACWVPPNLFL